MICPTVCFLPFTPRTPFLGRDGGEIQDTVWGRSWGQGQPSSGPASLLAVIHRAGFSAGGVPDRGNVSHHLPPRASTHTVLTKCGLLRCGTVKSSQNRASEGPAKTAFMAFPACEARSPITFDSPRLHS